MGGVKLGTALFFSLPLCAHNPKVEFALAITGEVDLLRTNLIP